MRYSLYKVRNDIIVLETSDKQKGFCRNGINFKPQRVLQIPREAFLLVIETAAIKKKALLLDSYKSKRTPKIEACRTVISELSKVAINQIFTLKDIWPIKTAGSRRVCKIFLGWVRNFYMKGLIHLCLKSSIT
jgi:hypothetical protein